MYTYIRMKVQKYLLQSVLKMSKVLMDFLIFIIYYWNISTESLQHFTMVNAELILKIYTVA